MIHKAATVVCAIAGAAASGCAAGSAAGTFPARSAQGNVLTSEALPEIQVRLDRSFAYVGRFEFEIRDIAYGERYIFVDASDHGRIDRLFIAQFEGFLPKSDEIYRYRFDDALVLGGHRFRQNTYAFSNREAAAANPDGEAARMARFLRDRAYDLEDELMMSRFVTVPDEERRHELILFYIENVSSSGHRLAEFSEDDHETEVWRRVSKGLTDRSRASFEVETPIR